MQRNEMHAAGHSTRFQSTDKSITIYTQPIGAEPQNIKVPRGSAVWPDFGKQKLLERRESSCIELCDPLTSLPHCVALRQLNEPNSRLKIRHIVFETRFLN